MIRSRSVAPCALLPLLALFLCLPADAQFPREYRDARILFMECDSSPNCDWTPIVEAMKAAADEAETEITQGTKAGTSVPLFGGVRDIHQPFFYLGEALYNAREFGAATDAWLRSRDLGFTRETDNENVLIARLREAAHHYYRSGRLFYQEPNWPGASDHLERVITIEDREGGEVKVGAATEIYLPHFYLGFAQYRRNNFNEALESWQESDQQGVAARHVAAQLQPGRLVEIARIRIHAESELAEAQGARSELQSPRRVWVFDRDQDLSNRFDQAKEGLTGIPEPLRQDPEAPGANAIADAAEELSALALELRTLIGQTDEYLRVYQIDRSVLKKGANIFFNDLGPEKYEDVVAAFSERSFRDSQLEAQAALFRGLGLYAIHLNGGDADLEEARSQLQRCRTLSSTCGLDPDYFSPSFIDFFDKSSSYEPPK